MSDDLERRAFVECRVASEDGRRIRGHAIVFNSLSVDLGGFQEVIAPEAVDRTLNEALDVRALVDHDSSKVLGRTRSGTLSLRKEPKGLKVNIEPDPEISYARDVLRAVARGDLSGMSFAFRVPPGGDEWAFNADDQLIRTITDMIISEVSIVTFPAYQATDVQVAQRSRQQAQALQGNRVAWLEKWHRTVLAKQRS